LRAVIGSLPSTLVLRRDVISHVDHVLKAVVGVSHAGLQRYRVRLTDHRLVEAFLILINDEVSGCPLLAAEDLALKHAAQYAA